MTKLKHLEIKDRKTSDPAHYVRINGRGYSIRLENEPGSPEYFAEYAEALSALKNGYKPPDRRKGADNHKVSELIVAFLDSNSFRQLRPSSRKTYKGTLKRIGERLGSEYFKDLKRGDIVAAIDDLSPHTANAFLSTFRRVIHWAILRELVQSDPTIGIKGPKRSRVGFPAWREWEIEIYKDRWPIGTRERLALDLLNYTGLRAADIIELGPQHVSDGFISKICQKNQTKVRLPLHPALEKSITLTDTGSKTFLRLKRFDKPFPNSNYFGQFFRAACDKAGLKKRGELRLVSAHGLRKTAAMRAIDRGATTNQAMAFQGWNDRTMLDHYVAEVDREKIGAEHGHMIFPEDEEDKP